MHQPSMQQEQLNKSVEAVKNMMRQVKGAQNPQMMLAQLLQSNPNTAAIAKMLQSNGNLEAIAKQMAASGNIDINQLITELSGGI